MGMLTVLPAYRRQGVATALMLHLAGQLMERGRTPYTHVHTDNVLSMKLHENLGFVRSEQPVTWLCKHDAYTDSRLN